MYKRKDINISNLFIESGCVTYKRMVTSQTACSSNKVPSTDLRRFHSLLAGKEDLILQTAKIIIVLFISCVTLPFRPQIIPVTSLNIRFLSLFHSQEKWWLTERVFYFLWNFGFFFLRQLFRKLSTNQFSYINTLWLHPGYKGTRKRAGLRWVTVVHFIFI